MVETVRLTTAQALVRWILAQEIEDQGQVVPVFAGVFAIFGHGNVVALGEALEPVIEQLPTWRGHNEQSMALAAIAFAKAKKRRQIMVATSSVGPGCTNMVTAAAVAHANRLPVLIISGDTFQSRLPDPVLQQIESFSDPTLTVSDTFRPVTRYWDRITRPEQLVSSLPQALATMLDPADCGPAYLGLPQDVAAESFDYPVEFFAPREHRIRRPVPDQTEIAEAAGVLLAAQRPLLIAGGGVHYSLATQTLADFAQKQGIPVVETTAGKSSLPADHPLYAGGIGVTGCSSANALAADADVVVAVGTRLGDFTTGSWAAFKHPDLKLISINVARFDATKHRAVSVVGDAQRSLKILDQKLDALSHQFHRHSRHSDEEVARIPISPEWRQRAEQLRTEWFDYLDEMVSQPEPAMTYGKAIRAIWEEAEPNDYQVSAAGGLPGELNVGWLAKSVGSYDAEYGYSCMGYEIAGAWGAKMALPDREVVSWVGDGSYLMMNSDIYSTVFTGHKVIFIVCDNGGYAVINRLQRNTGGVEFNNLLRHARHEELVRVDFVSHAAALGARSERVSSVPELKDAFRRAKQADRSTVIVVEVDEYTWTEGGVWWEVGIPEISAREEVVVAHSQMLAEKKHQRIG